MNDEVMANTTSKEVSNIERANKLMLSTAEDIGQQSNANLISSERERSSDVGTQDPSTVSYEHEMATLDSGGPILRKDDEQLKPPANYSVIQDTDDSIPFPTADMILNYEAENLRLPQDGHATPVGPGNAVDLIVASAARAAAGAALADSTTLEIPRTPTLDINSESFQSPNSLRRPRAKLVAAKSVLRSNPNRSRRDIALERGREIVKADEEKQAKKQKTSKTKQPSLKPESATKKQKIVSSPNKTAAKEIWSGCPTEKVEFSWDGWTKKTFQRQSGKTKGGTDSYWYTPNNKYKLRSLTEVRRFLQLCKDCGNEENAYMAFKRK